MYAARGDTYISRAVVTGVEGKCLSSSRNEKALTATARLDQHYVLGLPYRTYETPLSISEAAGHTTPNAAAACKNQVHLPANIVVFPVVRRRRYWQLVSTRS